MKVGLFFGSFNPIHVGHLMIAEWMAYHTDLEKVWLVVSPHNPLKDRNSLGNVYDRLEMCKLAIGDHDRISVSDIELKLPQPSYTVDTLIYLQEKYPQAEFSLIMGEDNLLSLPKWKNYEVLLANHRIFVYPRLTSISSDLKSHPQVIMTQTPIIEISASMLRNAIKAGKGTRYFLPDAVLSFIEAKGLYKS